MQTLSSSRLSGSTHFSWLNRYFFAACLLFMAQAGMAAELMPTTSSNESLQIKTVDNIKQRRIAVSSGSSMDLYASKKFPQATIIRATSVADQMLSLQTNKVDAVLLDSVSAKIALKSNPDLAIIDEKISPGYIAAAFRLKGHDLRERFDLFVAAIRQDGSLDEIHQRWYEGEPDISKMPKLALPTVGPKLRVGVDSNMGLPFVTIVDGAFYGFEAELAQRFALHEGYPLEFLLMEFSNLLVSLATEKTDIIISDVSITEERKQQVAFSQPYAEEYMSVLVRAADRTSSESPVGASTPTTAEPAVATGWLANLVSSIKSTFVVESRWKLILQGLWVTVIVSLFATVLGTLLGALVCFLRMSDFGPTRYAGQLYVGFVRGLPVLLLLMLIFYVLLARVNVDAVMVAIIAFGINFAAYVAEIFRSGIQSVDKGQFEAGIAMGFSRVKTFMHIILPQAIRNILPIYRNEFISLVKMTSIVGYIGAQDLTKASDIIRSRTFEAFFPLVMVALMYFLVIWVLGLALDEIDRRTDPAWRKQHAARA